MRQLVVLLYLNTLCTRINYFCKNHTLNNTQFIFHHSMFLLVFVFNKMFCIKKLKVSRFIYDRLQFCVLFNSFRVGNERGKKMETREIERKLFHYISSSSSSCYFAHSPCFYRFYSAYKLFSLNNYCLQKEKFKKHKMLNGFFSSRIH